MSREFRLSSDLLGYPPFNGRMVIHHLEVGFRLVEQDLPTF